MLATPATARLYEHFFQEVGKPMDVEAKPLLFEDQKGVERIVEIAAKYGIELPVPIAKQT